jgi:UTP--glucose-1-phosphate uridylyltransferase
LIYQGGLIKEGNPLKRIRKAVIPAAGYGTRFLPATKATPKEMLPIVDKPTIQYIVEEALQSGIEEILIISGHAKRAIEDHFDTNPGLEIHLQEHHDTELLKIVRSISEINIHYIRQKHMRGLGDAILCAQSFIDDEPFAVLLGDDVVYNDPHPALRQMIDVYNDIGATILGCQEVAQDKVSAYGIVKGVPVEGKPVLKVTSMIEKPSIEEAPSRIAALGRYIITPDVFEVLKRTEPGKGGEVQLTDALNTMAARESVYAYCFEGKRYDLGDKLGFLKATVEYALRRPDLGGPFREYLKSLVGHI